MKHFSTTQPMAIKEQTKVMLSKLLVIASMLLAMGLSLFHVVAQIPLGDAVIQSRLDWHPNGQMLAVSSGSSVQIIDANTLATLNVLPDSPAFVASIHWNPSGTRLAVASGWAIQIWEHPWDAQQAVNSLTLHPPTELQFPEWGIVSLDWNSMNNEIVGVGPTHVYVWESQTGDLLRIIDPATTGLFSAALSDDGMRLAWGNTTGYVLVEDLLTQRLSGGDTTDFDGVYALGWNSEGDELAAGTNSGIVQFFGNSSDGAMRPNGYISASSSPILSLDWHPTQDLLAVGRFDGYLDLWNPTTRSLVSSIAVGAPIPSVVWSPDGLRLAYSNQTTLSIMQAPLPPPSTAANTPNLLDCF